MFTALIRYLDVSGGILQRDEMVRNAQAIRNYSRELLKAHTHKKPQPSSAGQQRCTSPKKQPRNLGALHSRSYSASIPQHVSS